MVALHRYDIDFLTTIRSKAVCLARKDPAYTTILVAIDDVLHRRLELPG